MFTTFTVVPEPCVCTHAAGEFPWAAPTTNGSAPARQHFATRYRALRAQQARTAEEAAILPIEVVRTFAWLEERSAAVAARADQLGQQLRALEMGSAPSASDRLLTLEGGDGLSAGSEQLLAAEAGPAPSASDPRATQAAASCLNADQRCTARLLQGQIALLERQRQRLSLIAHRAQHYLGKCLQQWNAQQPAGTGAVAAASTPAAVPA